MKNISSSVLQSEFIANHFFPRGLGVGGRARSRCEPRGAWGGGGGGGGIHSGTAGIRGTSLAALPLSIELTAANENSSQRNIFHILGFARRTYRSLHPPSSPTRSGEGGKPIDPFFGLPLRPPPPYASGYADTLSSRVGGQHVPRTPPGTRRGVRPTAPHRPPPR